MKYKERFDNYIKKNCWFVGGNYSEEDGDSMYFCQKTKQYTNIDVQPLYEMFCAGIRSQQQYKAKKNAQIK